MSVESNYLYSTLRERIVEHVFVGDALRALWRKGVYDVEVLRSEFDAHGYDLVMARGKIVRHIQFKTGTQKKPATVSISRALVEKPSGCVIWIKLGSDLDMGPYFWLGGAPGEPLTSITQYPNSKRVTANSQGVRPIRKNHFDVPGAAFICRETLEEILLNLFGDLTATVVESADGSASEDGIMKITPPADLSKPELNQFIAFVEAGGEVNPNTLPGLVANAALLGRVIKDGELICSAALKRPNDHYWASTFESAHVSKEQHAFPIELGWVRTAPDFEGNGHAKGLIRALMERWTESGVYATTKSPVMRHILSQLGFNPLGNPYPSTLNPLETLNLYAKPL